MSLLLEFHHKYLSLMDKNGGIKIELRQATMKLITLIADGLR